MVPNEIIQQRFCQYTTPDSTGNPPQSRPLRLLPLCRGIKARRISSPQGTFLIFLVELRGDLRKPLASARRIHCKLPTELLQQSQNRSVLRLFASICLYYIMLKTVTVNRTDKSLSAHEKLCKAKQLFTAMPGHSSRSFRRIHILFASSKHYAK
jgi:hypothetical protein